jgi:hypothetical protein
LRYQPVDEAFGTRCEQQPQSDLEERHDAVELLREPARPSIVGTSSATISRSAIAWGMSRVAISVAAAARPVSA